MQWLPTLIIASAVVATSCGDSSASPEHGPLATLRLRTPSPSPDDLAYNAGFDDYFAWSNEHGGIGGYTFDLVDVQLGSDPSQYAQAVTAAKTAVGRSVYALFAVDNIDTKAVLPALDATVSVMTRADDPTLCVPNGVTTTVTLPSGQTAPDGSNPAQVNAPQVANVFHVGLDAGSGARIAMQELQNLDAHRVSFAVCTTPDTGCANGVLAGKAAAASLGITLGADLELPSTPETVPALVTAYLDVHRLVAGDWIWVGDNAAVAAALTTALVTYAAAHPAYAGVRVIVDSRAYGEPFRDACGAGCAGAVLGLVPITPFGDARPFLMTEVSNIYAEKHPGDPSLQTVRYVEGFVNAAVWIDAIRGLAITKLPVLVPTVRNGMEVGTPEGLGGLIVSKTFTATDHRALSASEIYGIDDNGLLSYAGTVSIEQTPETLGY